MHVAIIGGGIAGLATAYFLQQAAREPDQPLSITLIESGPAFGGKITSSHESGFVIEGGPDSFLTHKPAALKLCRELGLEDEFVGINQAARQVFVWSQGRLRPMPPGVMLSVPTKIGPFLRSSLISWPGKLRMGLEMFIPGRSDAADESLAHFVRRRLGREALEKIAEPMMASIHAANADRLSIQGAFPHLRELEQTHGSLIRGMRAQQRNADPPRAAIPAFITLRGGLQRLVDRLVERLQSQRLILNRPVSDIAFADGQYVIRCAGEPAIQADRLVLATPAYVSAELVRGADPALAAALAVIDYVSTATVSLGFRRAEFGHPLDGFGFVVPKQERRSLLACTWTSTKFTQRAPAECVLLRAFIGGADAEPLIAQDDQGLVALVRTELKAMMGIDAAPVFSKVFRWPRANPQYEVGHHERIAAIERQLEQRPGLHLAGSAYHGSGIPNCIDDGRRVAAAILKQKAEQS
jgi:oxygen-dependent protoporphyrinogen oxidase